MNRISCILCKSKNLSEVINLGFHPLADTFLKKQQLQEPEVRYPLTVVFCGDCGHLMSGYSVPPEIRYQANDYSYDSSNSKVAINHFKEMAEEVILKAGVKKNDLVVDVGSNVGTLLSFFSASAGAKVLGIEPSKNIAELALKNKIPTVNNFFNKSAEKEILKIKKAKIITATNVFNHIDDLNGFMEIADSVLTDDGYLVVEAPYGGTLIKETLFDTIYLEHVSYFLIKPLVEFFKKFNFTISNIYLNDYMGGSARIYVKRGKDKNSEVDDFIKKEQEAGFFSKKIYDDFMSRTRNFKAKLCKDLYEIKSRGGIIIGIGAATKGSTLLNYCSINSDILEYITDASPLKIGKYAPGSHLLIRDDKEIGKEITHALILPWNIGEFLKTKLKHLPVEFLVPQITK